MTIEYAPDRDRVDELAAKAYLRYQESLAEAEARKRERAAQRAALEEELAGEKLDEEDAIVADAAVAVDSNVQTVECPSGITFLSFMNLVNRVYLELVSAGEGSRTDLDCTDEDFSEIGLKSLVYGIMRAYFKRQGCEVAGPLTWPFTGVTQL